MRKLLFVLPFVALAACSSVTPSTVVTTAVDGTACFLAADAVASDADTLANTQAVAVVLATNPACVGVAQSTLTAIQNAEAPAPVAAPVVVAPVVAPVVVAPAAK